MFTGIVCRGIEQIYLPRDSNRRSFNLLQNKAYLERRIDKFRPTLIQKKRIFRMCPLAVQLYGLFYNTVIIYDRICGLLV
jgi:hypothetical protein